jgi:cytoskeletal protein CcmA (bactofilin family)
MCVNVVASYFPQGDTQFSKVHDELKRAEYPLQPGTFVGAGLRIQGEISGNEDMLVEGIVEGPIQLGDGMLTVGAAGKITADVVAREVIVYGKLEGNLTARDRIQIKNVGSVVGDLATARIIIEDGANLKGSIEIVNRDKSPQALASTDASSKEREHNRAFTAGNSG